MTTKELEKQVKELQREYDKRIKENNSLTADNELLRNDLERTRRESQAKNPIPTLVRELLYWETTSTPREQFLFRLKMFFALTTFVCFCITIYHFVSAEPLFSFFNEKAKIVLDASWGNTNVIDLSAEIRITQHELKLCTDRLLEMEKNGLYELNSYKHLVEAKQIFQTDLNTLLDHAKSINKK